MIVRDIVKMKGSTVFSIAPGGDVSEALAVMVRNDIGFLVVLDGSRLAGMLSFREILKALDEGVRGMRAHREPRGGWIA